MLVTLYVSHGGLYYIRNGADFYATSIPDDRYRIAITFPLTEYEIIETVSEGAYQVKKFPPRGATYDGTTISELRQVIASQQYKDYVSRCGELGKSPLPPSMWIELLGVVEWDGVIR